jgi:cellulose synthase/poly-beta-1,6-N-acetylglucosamine synthase-like glycosyltransferase/HEAT repeat protein
MILDKQIIINLFIFFAIIDTLLIIGIILEKYLKKYQRIKLNNMQNLISKNINNPLEIKIEEPKYFMQAYAQMNQSIMIDEKTKKEFMELIKKYDIEKKYIKRINSKIKSNLIQAIVYLGEIGTEECRLVLEEKFENENDYIIKLYIAYSLYKIHNKNSIPILVESLINSPKPYKEKIQVMLSKFENDFHDYILTILDRKEIEIQMMIIYFASHYMDTKLKSYLISKSRDENIEISRAAVQSLSKNYFNILNDAYYLYNKDLQIQKTVIKTLSKINTKENIDQLIPFLENDETYEYAIYSLSNILRENPKFLEYLIDIFENEKNNKIKKNLANVISIKIEYFFFKLLTNEKDKYANLIYNIILSDVIGDTIDFLNKNKNIPIERIILPYLKKAIKKNEYIKKEFQLYINKRILNELSLKRIIQKPPKKDTKREKDKIENLIKILIGVFTFFPLLFVLRHGKIIPDITFIEGLKLYIYDFNWYLIIYVVILNAIYLILVIISYFEQLHQEKMWNLKFKGLLYTFKILPGISIIAPAYNETEIIIESTNALLNLQYPDYDVIVVNDGSTDDTLEKLIDYFNLEKTDYILNKNLNTKPIRGIYINKSIPKLIVVDKENGGKADSLNTGLNISKKEFFCGIDADSILESDALLKITSLKMDTDHEMIAIGGNILPLNGCKVSKGYIEKINLPFKTIERFQTVEYIRSFMAGRLGWARINSMLIISGAFGLFNRKRIIEAGGYLSEQGKYKKDTVGEDMELVVRINRDMYDKKIKHKIGYSYNANCWTEVPPSYLNLYKQRDRWHRGLIDILIFHRNLMFNPRYGKMGFISIPYFFIFELIGPLIEIQGYLMIVLAGFFNILSLKMGFLLFLTTIFIGVTTSLASLIIAEDEVNYFSKKETFLLILFSFLENFGPRQFMSFVRLNAFNNSLKKPMGWSKFERIGFEDKNKKQ